MMGETREEQVVVVSEETPASTEAMLRECSVRIRHGAAKLGAAVRSVEQAARVVDVEARDRRDSWPPLGK